MESENFNVEFEEVVNIGGGTSDFNELSNRPKYNNETMTGDTNIPEVPTKTSDLTNDGADGTSTYVEADNLATVATSGDYDDLSNKPTIPTVNNATLTITQNGVSKGTFTANASDDTTIEVPNTTYSDFTGTDGTTAGTHGLVPAPATTDAGKFLKADGTWDTAGGSAGGVTELTTADYNYPTDNPTHVALWTLPAGLYYRDNSVNAYAGDGRALVAGQNFIQVIKSSGSSVTNINIMGNIGGANDNVSQLLQSFRVTASGTIADFGGTLTTSNIKATTGTSTTDVMSQNAVSSMVFADPSTTRKIQIGDSSSTVSSNGISIGYASSAGSSSAQNCVAIGSSAAISGGRIGSVALGANSGGNITKSGMVDIGSAFTSYGYEGNSNYRLLTGLYDPQSDHDAATKGYVDTLVGDIETALNVINNGGNS